MKIGIFGDSYGYYDSRFKTESWVTYLSQDFDVTSYCENGSSTYLIYKNFIEYQHLYDKVIVLVTYPIRLHTSILAVPSSSMAKFWTNIFRQKLTYTQKQILNATGNFIDIIQEDNELTNQFILFHNLMLEKLKSTRKDILFVPCFSIPETEFTETSLYHISMMEEAVWGEKWETVLKRNARPYDERQCHMCNQNNFILYQQIKEAIPLINGHTVFKIDLSTFVKPDDISNYIPTNYYE